MYYWNVCFDTLRRERFSVDSEGIERLIQFSTICGSRHLICQIARIVSGQHPVLNMTLRKMIPTVTPLRKEVSKKPTTKSKYVVVSESDSEEEKRVVRPPKWEMRLE